jgi:N-acetylmuramoyl-L-alanine amidase
VKFIPVKKVYLKRHMSESLNSLTYWHSINLYHEARGEPLEGQVLVVHTVQNRVYNRGLTVKGIIYQPAQFSWTNNPDKRNMPITEFHQKSYLQCREAVEHALALYLDGNTSNGVDHYHHHAINPYWVKGMNQHLGQIGKHIFYRS